ncbi:MAG: ROK family protein [Candidatus Caenarcaniphilales bacterium]|nr:ROK family protein [Candidatus Caenarcaniphilales bacterium]
MNPENLESIAIDFGASNTRLAHFKQNRISKLIEFATPEEPNEFIAEFKQKVMAIDLSNVLAVGVGACGYWDRNCILRQSLNLANYVNYPLWTEVSEILQLPTLLKSDVELAAMGEAIHGEGDESESLLYINMGTGFSGALYKDGEIFTTSYSPTLRLDFLVQPESISAENSSEEELEMDPEEKREKSITLLSTTLINLSFILSPQIISIGGGKVTDERWTNIIKPAIDKAMVYLKENLTYEIQIKKSQVKYPTIYGAHELVKRNLNKLALHS